MLAPVGFDHSTMLARDAREGSDNDKSPFRHIRTAARCRPDGGDKGGTVGSEDTRDHLRGLQVAADTRKQPETADHRVVAFVQARCVVWCTGKTRCCAVGMQRGGDWKTLETIFGVPSSSDRRHLSDGHPSTRQLPSSAAATPAKKRKKERSLHRATTLRPRRIIQNNRTRTHDHTTIRPPPEKEVPPYLESPACWSRV